MTASHKWLVLHCFRTALDGHFPCVARGPLLRDSFPQTTLSLTEEASWANLAKDDGQWTRVGSQGQCNNRDFASPCLFSRAHHVCLWLYSVTHSLGTLGQYLVATDVPSLTIAQLFSRDTCLYCIILGDRDTGEQSDRETYLPAEPMNTHPHI